MKNDLTPQTIQEVRDGAIRKSTKESYEYDIKVFKKYCDENNISDPTVTDVKKYFEYSIQHKKYSTVRRYRASLTRYHPQLTSLDVRTTLDNLFKSFRQNKPPNTKHSVPIDLVTYYRLLDLTVREDYKLILRLMWKSGARISDVLNLTVDDISYVNDKDTNRQDWVSLRFKARKQTNQATELGLQYSSELGKWINTHIQKNRLRPEDKMFSNIHRNVLKRHIERKIGHEYGNHSFRSGHVIHVLKEGATDSKTMHTIGNKNYSCFVENYARAAHRFDNTTDITDID